MKISRVLHAGYIFEDLETRIIFDPVFENPFSVNCFAFPPVKFDLEAIRNVKFDAIFISHYHDDHCSFKSLDLLNRKTPLYIYCVHDDLFELVRKLGFSEVRSLETDREVKVGKFTVTPRQALDSDIDSILQIRRENLNVLNVVDSMIDPATLDLLQSEAPWDLVFWPFQAMREVEVLSPSRFQPDRVDIPEEWISELKILNPKFVVPSSCQFIHEDWSWYNQALFPITYKKFEKVIGTALPSAEIIRMNPSESFFLSPASMTKASSMQKVDSLSWMAPIGEQNVDYDYRPEAGRPTTSEIATHFAGLNDDETARVIKYCDFEMLDHYRSLDPTPYFDQPRLWRLSLYDPRGIETKWLYRVEKSTIAIASAFDLELLPLAWVTEAPMAKVYAALDRGEALTSMYIRVNDVKFTAEIENDLSEMDVLEDPLIRTLFNGKFGAYQREQLKMLQSCEKST